MVFLSKYIIYYLAGTYIPYSEKILIILGFIPFVAMLNFKNHIIMLIEDKKKILNQAVSVSTLIMILFSVVGSYLYGGIGISIALIISEFFSFLIHSYLLKKRKIVLNN